MEFCKPEILLTWRNTIFFRLFGMIFLFNIVVIGSWILFALFLGHEKAQTAIWKHIGSSARQQFNAWSVPAPVFERSLLPHELLEIFLTNTEMEKTCIESTNYAHFKDNHKSAMTLEKLKAFLTILIVSGYAGLPRLEMYWQRVEDCHNLVVSAMMPKTEFHHVDHQMWLVMCPQISLQHVGKIIKLWMRSPPLLVNKQFNSSTFTVIVKNRDWILNNQTS